MNTSLNCAAPRAKSRNTIRKSPLFIEARDGNPQSSRFLAMTRKELGFRSPNTARSAPRLSASMPRAPLPANRSSTCPPLHRNASKSKMVCRTRSAVGLTSNPAGASKRRPRASPDMTRIDPQHENTREMQSLNHDYITANRKLIFAHKRAERQRAVTVQPALVALRTSTVRTASSSAR